MLLLGGYYALIFGYAARVRAERREHVAWRFPLRGGSDYCADTMPNGACVCSDAGTVYIVRDGRQTGKFVAFQTNEETRSYPPYEGYQWVGGTKDSLAFISAAKPPMDELTLYAVESDGKVRWQAKLPPGEIVSWIACSPDSVYVQTYQSASAKATRQRNFTLDCGVYRYDLHGKLIYAIKPKIGVFSMGVARDNWVYLGDNTQGAIEARDPSGKLMWTTKTGGIMPAYSNYIDGKTLYFQDQFGAVHAVGRDGKERFKTGLPQSSRTGISFGEQIREMFGTAGSSYYSNFGSYITVNIADGGGNIYVICDDTVLVAVDCKGKLLWQRTLRSHALCVVADSKGCAYVTLNSGGLVCYSPDGKELWRNSSMHRFSSAMSVGADDRVLVEADGELICIRQ